MIKTNNSDHVVPNKSLYEQTVASNFLSTAFKLGVWQICRGTKQVGAKIWISAVQSIDLIEVSCVCVPAVLDTRHTKK